MESRGPVILRRFALWTVICTVSAAPSFFWAQGEYSRDAMVLGVALFILAYTALTSTAAFDRFHRRPFIRRTLYIGYGTRLGLSLAFPLGIWVDLWPGMFSVGVVNRLGLGTDPFAHTLLITLVQGAVLNAMIFLLMIVAYGIQRATMDPVVPEDPRRGFAVLPVAMPINAGNGVSPSVPAPHPPH